MDEMNEVNIRSLNRAKEHPIKVSVVTSVLVSLILLLGFIWLFVRPALGEELAKYFVTKTEMRQHTDEVMSQLDVMQTDQKSSKTAFNGLRIQVNLASAFQMERGFKDDLNEHDAGVPNPPTAKWRAGKREIEDKLKLVAQYTDCVLNERKNCEQLQRQLWR